MHRTEKQTSNRRKVKRLIAVAVMVAALVALLAQTVFAQNCYLITDGEKVQVHKSFSSDPDVVLNEAGIELSDEDTYTTTYDGGLSCIEIQRLQAITVVFHGENIECTSYGETVNELLSRMELALTPEDVLSCDGNTATYDGMTVRVFTRETKTETYEAVIPYLTNSYEDPELAEGEVIILVEGKDGLSRNCDEVTYEDGVEVSRQSLSQEILEESVTELVVRGPVFSIASQDGAPVSPVSGAEPEAPADLSAQPTRGITATSPTEPIAENGILTTTSGNTYRYTQALTVSCTAYSCGDRVGYTYSGTVARVGAVAVDPRYIPLGTKMYIVSNDGCYIYGYCIAEDIGGGIKGLRIDLYFDTFDECWEFGVRDCTAYILE